MPEPVQHQLEEGVQITEDPECGEMVQWRLLEPDNDEAETLGLGALGSPGHSLGEEGARTETEAGAQGQHQVCVPPYGLRSLQQITPGLVPPLENWVGGVKPGTTEKSFSIMDKLIASPLISVTVSWGHPDFWARPS